MLTRCTVLIVALHCWLIVGPGVARAQDKKDGDEPLRLAWHGFDPRVNKEYFQEVVTETDQVMKVMGMEVKQKQKQTFVFRWTPLGFDAKSNCWRTQQEFIRVKADIDIGGSVIQVDTDRADGGMPLNDFFRALLKARLTCTVDSSMRVAGLSGHEEIVRNLKAASPGTAPLLQTLMSKEAMGSMLESTWHMLPLVPVRKGDAWKRVAEINAGPVGSYITTYLCQYDGKDELDKISFTTALKYQLPKDGAAGMPFKIKSADFREGAGKGFALFDRRRGLIMSLQVHSMLEGRLTIEIGGMETTIDLQQKQTVRSRVSDERPK